MKSLSKFFLKTFFKLIIFDFFFKLKIKCSQNYKGKKKKFNQSISLAIIEIPFHRVSS